jgi:uncharacterized membrane protein
MSKRIKKDRRIAAVQISDETTQASAEYSFMALRQSPLPPSAELEKFETLYPGVTKLVFDNFINQSNHRMELEKSTILADNKRANRGQVISAVLVFLCVLIGGFLIFFNKNIEGIVMVLTSLGVLITAFYGGAILRINERIRKEKR